MKSNIVTVTFITGRGNQLESTKGKDPQGKTWEGLNHRASSCPSVETWVTLPTPDFDV